MSADGPGGGTVATMSTPAKVQPGSIPRKVQKALLASLPKSPMDLFSPEERQKLHDDLAGMAKKRRRAEAESALIVMH